MRATLYSVYTSHPAHAARLMLEHKGIEHKVVNLVPGVHGAAVLALGFRGSTVPALSWTGAASRARSRSLARSMKARPEPALFPDARPLTWYNARRVEASDTEHVRKTVEMLPSLLDQVDELLDEGTIGGEARNAADFQIGTSVRLLMTFADLAPALEGRPAARFATDLMPDHPTSVPAGVVPPEWCELFRSSPTE